MNVATRILRDMKPKAGMSMEELLAFNKRSNQVKEPFEANLEIIHQYAMNVDDLPVRLMMKLLLVDYARQYLELMEAQKLLLLEARSAIQARMAVLKAMGVQS